MGEYAMRVLEVLRQPLEDKIVTISRARGSHSFPANFMLVAAMNPCPCSPSHQRAGTHPQLANARAEGIPTRVHRHLTTARRPHILPATWLPGKPRLVQVGCAP
jgi:hypothetical protein